MKITLEKGGDVVVLSEDRIHGFGGTFLEFSPKRATTASCCNANISEVCSDYEKYGWIIKDLSD